MSKNSNTPEYSRDREFTVILENLQSQFEVFGEGLISVQNGLETVSGRLQTVEKKLVPLEQLPSAVKQLHNDLHQFKSFVQKVLPEVATKDDLRRLEKRLTILEASR